MVPVEKCSCCTHEILEKEKNTLKALAKWPQVKDFANFKVGSTALLLMYAQSVLTISLIASAVT